MQYKSDFYITLLDISHLAQSPKEMQLSFKILKVVLIFFLSDILKPDMHSTIIQNGHNNMGGQEEMGKEGKGMMLTQLFSCVSAL